MKVTMNIEKVSPAAQAHIRAEFKRHIRLTGHIEETHETIERIVSEHAVMHEIAALSWEVDIKGVSDVSSLVDAFKAGEVRIIDAGQDTSALRFIGAIMGAVHKLQSEGH